MKLLLDTHVFLWWRAEPERLTREAHGAIARADLVFVSAASAWEAAEPPRRSSRSWASACGKGFEFAANALEAVRISWLAEGCA